MHQPLHHIFQAFLMEIYFVAFEGKRIEKKKERKNRRKEGKKRERGKKGREKERGKMVGGGEGN